MYSPPARPLSGSFAYRNSDKEKHSSTLDRLDAKLAVKHPQGSRVFAGTPLFGHRDTRRPRAAVSAAGRTSLCRGRRRGVQQRGQACFIASAAMRLHMGALRRTRAQRPCGRSVQSAVGRDKRPVGNGAQSWKRPLRLPLGRGPRIANGGLRGSLQGWLVRRLVTAGRRRSLGMLLAMVRRQRGRLWRVLQRW